MLAVGSLKKIWLDIPQDVSEEEYKKAFEDYFGSPWEEVLDAVDISFEYNVYNTGYFSVGDIEAVKDITLDQLLDEKDSYQPPNVVAG